MQTQNRNKNNPAVSKQVSIAEIAPSSVIATSELSETRSIGGKAYASTLGPLLIYWALCLIVGFAVLHEQIFSWRIPDSWQKQSLFLVLAVVVTSASQVTYWLVARNDGRRFEPIRALVFILLNGPIECFMFLSAYQLFFNGAKLIFGNLNWLNVAFGVFGFVFYSGFIHAFFWARLLPRHFSAEPRLQTLRRLQTPIQAAIVLVWCLYFYKTGDIWTLVALHMLIDTILMVRVRPPVLTFVRATKR